jgi:membrane-bound serine protease (ClpP class)
MKKILFLVFTLVAQFQGMAQQTVLVFKLMDEISPKTRRYTQKAFAQAAAINAQAIILHLNTYGGLLDDADSIRSAILNSKIPVYVYINNNAASAGALISLACDSIYMHPGGTIGAASVVNQNGELLPDKYQSYMRGIMRSTATQNHRRGEIAEAMVDGNIVVDSINEKGQVITFTTEEAIKYGYCEGKVNSLQEVLQRVNLEQAEIVYYEPSGLDKVIGVLTSPFLSGILILLILGGIYFEFQHPGALFPIGVSMIAALLYFAPNYLDGLAANWEIVLFFLGLILLLLEIFVIPGFGFTGITGIVFLVSSLVLALVKNQYFNFDGVQNSSLNLALKIVSISFILTIVMAIVLSRFITSRNFFERIALTQTMSESKLSNSIAQRESVLNKKGICITDMKPQGKVEIGGTVYNAVSSGEFIDSNCEVVVYKENPMMIWVRKVPST